MENCIFCKIVKGELPSYKIYEDDHFIALLDINPLAVGHAQVVPKKHYRWVWDLDNTGEFFKVVQKIALAQRKAFNTEWVLSKIVGDEIEHAHIWVYPNREVSGDKMDFEGNAKKIRDALASLDKK